MGFAIDADRLVATLWEQFRPEWPSEAGTERLVEAHMRRQDGRPLDHGLVVTLDLRMSHFSLGGDEYHRSALVHTVLCGNTSVFTCTTRGFRKWNEIPFEEWENTSNHDSCWRTDGLRHFHLLHCKFADEMNEEIRSHGSNGLAPREFNTFVSLGTIAGRPWTHVRVDHERTPGENYKRRLLSIVDQGC